MKRFILETTRPGKLPRKAFMAAEETARGQMQKALNSGRFERVVLIQEDDDDRRVVFDSAAPRKAAVAAASVKRGRVGNRAATWAMVLTLIAAVTVYALDWLFNG
jgi:hypothetical protein